MSSPMTDAINAAGTRAWILLTVLDHCGDEAAITFALRNVRCDAIRAAIAAVPADGAFKVPTRRTAVIALAHNAVRHCRAYGYIQASTVAA